MDVFSLQSVVVEHNLPVSLTRKGTLITLPGAKELIFERAGGNDAMTATRTSPSTISSTTPQFDNYEAARAVLAPGKVSINLNQGDINLFHQSRGHLHEGLLRETAKQQRVILVGTLQECKGCPMGGCASPFLRPTNTRAAVKPFERVLIDAYGPKLVEHG